MKTPEKQQIINEYLKDFFNNTECCDEPHVLNVYKDDDGNFQIDVREICFSCLEHL